MKLYFQFNYLIKALNSLCWINNIFSNEGNRDGISSDNKKDFGIIIWKNRKTSLTQNVKYAIRTTSDMAIVRMSLQRKVNANVTRRTGMKTIFLYILIKSI